MLLSEGAKAIKSIALDEPAFGLNDTCAAFVTFRRRNRMADQETSPPSPLPSLGDIHGSVAVPKPYSFWRRLFAFVGPAYLVSVGYMDPGNWATDIAAGSQLGYSLIWVLAMSNVMAILLQTLSARLGIASGLDLAQACRLVFGKPLAVVLWVLAEIAITATDLAELLGSAIGLHILFGLPVLLGVALTAFDVMLLQVLQSHGVRRMEAFIVALISTIGICLGIEVFIAKPDWHGIAGGFVPSLGGENALYLAVGIVGATIMPHNLYLHSALVQSRRIVRTPAGVRAGMKFNFIDSVVALNGAFLVNAALLVMAAATFYRAGHHDVADIQDAHRLLEPILGAHIAPIAFAIALIASGQASTITGTLAGQIVMEGFIHLRVRPVLRRLITRSAAILPAVATIYYFGERGTGNLLVLSQVILSLQLSFAVIPLIHFVSDRRLMGQYVVRAPLRAAAWIVAGVIVFLNVRLAHAEIAGWIDAAGGSAWVLHITVLPLAAALAVLLLYVTCAPAVQRLRGVARPAVHGVHDASAVPEVKPPHALRRIGAAVDFTAADGHVLSHAMALARLTGRAAHIVIFHVVESGGARMLGSEMRDQEAHADQERLELYTVELGELGVEATYDLGFGTPAEELAGLVARHHVDIIVVGSHGHRGLGDFVHGTSVERLRHLVTVPVLAVPAS
jgi:manganese transport protein